MRQLLRKSCRCLRENWLVCLGLGWLFFIAVVPVTSWPLLSDQIRKAESEDLQKWGWYLLGAGIAPLTLLLTHNRTQSLRMQTEALKAQTKALKVQTDTDVFIKSIKLLGDEKAAVRQGGIYSLGKIAKYDSKLHPTIMKIMTSYIRGETYQKFYKRLQEENLTKEELTNKLADDGEPMSSDIEAAIEVIRKQKTSNDKLSKDDKKLFQFDLSDSYLFNANFGFIKELSRTNFSGSVIQGCRFNESNLSGSYFLSSNFQKSLFVDSILKHCEFEDIDFRNCDFGGAKLSGSKFRKCDPGDFEVLTQEQIDMKKSDLRGSSFIKATLENCEFRDTDFRGCDFRDCDLSGSKFENCGLTGAKHLTQEQIDNTEIDSFTKLSEGISYPKIS